MSDKSSLLNQLRIDRGEPAPEGRPLWQWGALAGGVVIVLAVGGWLIFGGSPGIPVQAAVARSAAAAGAPASGSLLDASGYVVARRQATVSSKVTGKVMEVLIEEGRHVDQGEIIARLDDSNIKAAVEQAKAQVQQSEANLAAAKAAFDNTRPVHERNKELQAKGWISATAFDNSKGAFDAAQTNLAVSSRALDVARASLAATQRTLDDFTVRAPFAGIVTVKNAQPGEMISPNSAGGGFTRTGIGTIVDMDSLEVEVDVSESFISRVRPGQAAAIKLNAYPDWQIPGSVIAVIPTADRAKATVKVRIGFKEKDARIVPEMGARVSFLNDAPQAAGAPPPAPGVIVPVEAVQASGDTGVVFLIKDNVLERRSVRLGARNPDGQTILSGVAPGESVAVGDFAQLKDGVKVKVE